MIHVKKKRLLKLNINFWKLLSFAWIESTLHLQLKLHKKLTGKWVLQMINANLPDNNDKYYPMRLCSSNSLLNPSLITSFTSIAQTIIKQDSKLFAYSFAFWKSPPSAHLTTILRLWRLNLSYRGKKNKKGSVKYSIYCCFPTYLKLLF